METDKKGVSIALEWLCYVQPITVIRDYIIHRTSCDTTYAISTLQDAQQRSMWTNECAVARGSIRPCVCIERSSSISAVLTVLYAGITVEVLVTLRCGPASLDGRRRTFQDSRMFTSCRVLIPLIRLRCSGMWLLVVYYIYSQALGSCDRASWAKYEERRLTRCNN